MAADCETKATEGESPRKPTLWEDLNRIDSAISELTNFTEALGWTIYTDPDMCTELYEYVHKRLRAARALMEDVMSRNRSAK
ncbi:MAG: hypothetical protein AAF225_08145 [Pseudomonadota bacterium]